MLIEIREIEEGNYSKRINIYLMKNKTDNTVGKPLKRINIFYNSDEEQYTLEDYKEINSTNPDEINNVKCVFHSHPSLKQELEDDINRDYPNSSNLQIIKFCGYKNMNCKDKYGFYYVGIFNDGNSQITKTYAAAISSNDIDNSTKHPEILSLVFSPDFDEYCIILNGQI